MSGTTGIDPVTQLPFDLNNPLLLPGTGGKSLPATFAPATSQGRPTDVLTGDLPGAPRVAGIPAGPPVSNPDGSLTNPDGSKVFPGLTLFPDQPNSTGSVLPRSPASTINWLEEIAIRAMLLVVGLVLIAGGLKIAAARGTFSASSPAQLATRAGIPLPQIRRTLG
jgi:hypothetical protein